MPAIGRRYAQLFRLSLFLVGRKAAHGGDYQHAAMAYPISHSLRDSAILRSFIAESRS